VANIEDTIRKVQALMAQADHPNTSPTEADIFRVKAEELMTKYRIEEHHLSETQQVALGPVWRTMQLTRLRSEFANHYYTLAMYCVQHLDVRVTYKVETIDHESWYVLEMVGYESDLQFAMMLITDFMLAFSKKLEPKVDPALSDQENAYWMRKAGMEGKRIAHALFGQCTKSDPPKVRAMFKREAQRRGEDPAEMLGQGNTMKIYRRSYADGFILAVNDRLWRMRNSNDEKSALVLVSRKEAVDEAFYERYPARRPKPQIGDGYNEGACPKCKKAKSGLCRDHSWRKPRERKVNAGAYYRGQDAAQAVQLGGTNNQLGG
jgi:hypothetical protein